MRNKRFSMATTGSADSPLAMYNRQSSVGNNLSGSRDLKDNNEVSLLHLFSSTH